jgi:hypothetical protein
MVGTLGQFCQLFCLFLFAFFQEQTVGGHILFGVGGFLSLTVDSYMFRSGCIFIKFMLRNGKFAEVAVISHLTSSWN